MRIDKINLPQQIKYISAECGAGKGVWLQQEVIKAHNSGKRCIIVQETKINLEQTYQYLKSHGIHQKLILADNTHKNLLQDIIAALSGTATAILITDKMFFQIPIEKLDGFKIIIDDCQGSFDIKISGVRDEDKENLMEIYNRIFTNMKPYEKLGFSTFEFASKSDISEDYNQIMDGYKSLNMFHTKIVGNDFFYEDAGQLTAVGWYDYSRYKHLDITITMNAFEKSLVYKMNPELFVEIPFTPVANYNEDNYSRLTVYYYSKARGRNGLSASKLRGHDSVKAVNQRLRDTLTGDYIWCTNSNSCFSLPGHQLSMNQRGVNNYQNYTKWVWMAAVNPHPQAAKVMEDLFGIDGDDWMAEKELEAMNQFAFRTALRKYDDTMVEGHVYDIEQAEFFERKGAKIIYVPVVKEGIPAKLKATFKSWKCNQKGDYAKFEVWAAKQIKKGASLEHIQEFRNSLN